MATLTSIIDGGVYNVTPSIINPACSYGQPVWEDELGVAICQMGMEKAAGYSLQIEDWEQICFGLRIARQRQGISIRDFAKRCGTNLITIQRIEKAVSKPRLDIVCRMARQLGKPLALQHLVPLIGTAAK
ncbi:MAG: helix-turn-helix transcriptional regulator [Bacteroidales bacterium]|nr:helix-turn-helix transcriptional regulator [Bacteroidales bacterium]